MLPHAGKVITVFAALLVFNLQAQNASWVNPFIGTGGHGHTFPGAVWPFGMVQLSPDTRIDGSWDGCSGYHYSDSIIYGFSHTHLSGTGVSDWGDVLLMPSNYSQGADARKYAARFSHKNEGASPGQYSVTLNNGINVRLAVTPRTGIHQYHFNNKPAFMMLDLLHRDKLLLGNIAVKDSVTITGTRVSKAWANEQHCYFAIRFSKPFKRMQFTVNSKFIEVGEFKRREFPEGALFYFGDNLDEPLLVKVGLSNVDEAGALKNLETEAASNNFDYYTEQASNAWNKELGKITITENNQDTKSIFYTALYHCFIHPSLDMDIDNRYRGRDNTVHTANGFTHYNVFSLWDTYRALHPLFTLLDVQRTNDFINTFLVQYQESKRLPVWELSSNETDCMIGYHSVSVITDAFTKGINGFNSALALQAMKEAAKYEKYGIAKFYEKKFLEINDESESVSKSLEYAYDNWCIAQMCAMLNDKKEIPELIKTSQAYKNLFDASTGFMRPRINGNWYSPFSPYEINNHFTEGNSWHYSFYVPHDIDGLIKLHGGDAKFEKKLDELFTTKIKTSGRDQADVTGLIGQYAHGNEPSHHSAFLYHYIGKPAKTQEKVNKILSGFYTNAPDGLIGNDDCGQLSAWYVMSACGFYQVCPGKPDYVLLQPQFRKTEWLLGNGKKLEINAELNPNKRLSGTELNSLFSEKSYISHQVLEGGGQLNFIYKLKTDTTAQFGVSKQNRPVTTVKDFTLVPSPIISYTAKTFKTAQTVSIKEINNTKGIIRFTSNNKPPTKNQPLYQKPFLVSTTTQIRAKVYTETDSSVVAVANLFRINPSLMVKTKNVPNKQYAADGPQSLVDGIYADIDWRKGDWMGFQGQDVEIIVELKNPKMVESVSANFLQDTRSWIVFPTEVSFYGATDGKNYKLLETVSNTISAEDYTMQAKKFSTAPFKNQKYSHIKIAAKNFGLLPEWHDGRGGESFIFMDEIEVK